MENIPFVDVMDVVVVSPDTIKIVVYEKALAGYIEFMDSYMYFDRDGYMVETSRPKCKGARLNKDVLNVYVGKKNIYELTCMSILDLIKFFDKLKLNDPISIFFANQVT